MFSLASNTLTSPMKNMKSSFVIPLSTKEKGKSASRGEAAKQSDTEVLTATSAHRPHGPLFFL